jgi:two-component SAPR family response regulator
LSVDGRRCLAFLEQAARRGIGEQFLARLIRRLKRPAVSLGQAPAVREEIVEPPRIQVRALGATEVRVDGRLVSAKHWGAQSARELFVYLLLHRDGARRDQLLAALAPESSPARATSQFHVAAYRIRHALYKNCVRFDGDVYQIDPRLECEFDVEDFLAACRAAHAAQPGSDEELAALERAAALYGGRFLEGCYAEWALQQQSELEERYLSLLGRLARRHLQRGGFDAAHSAAQKALAVDNNLEELHEIALRALVAAGRLAEAHRHLNAYAAYLRDELGEEVPAAFRRLLEAAKAGRHLAAVV